MPELDGELAPPVPPMVIAPVAVLARIADLPAEDTFPAPVSVIEPEPEATALTPKPVPLLFETVSPKFRLMSPSTVERLIAAAEPPLTEPVTVAPAPVLMSILPAPVVEAKMPVPVIPVVSPETAPPRPVVASPMRILPPWLVALIPRVTPVTVTPAAVLMVISPAPLAAALTPYAPAPVALTFAPRSIVVAPVAALVAMAFPAVAVTVPAPEVVTVRLSAPVTVAVYWLVCGVVRVSLTLWARAAGATVSAPAPRIVPASNPARRCAETPKPTDAVPAPELKNMSFSQ